MKVSDILKKISTMQDAQIRITFKENRYDPDPVTECLKADTPDDIKVQAIERGKEYSVVDIEVWQDTLTITAVKIPKRTPKPKREKPEPAAGQTAEDDRLKEDIKDIEHERIQINPLYKCGSRRVGCVGCPMAGQKRWEEFEKYPKYKEAYIRAFGKMLEERERRGLENKMG